MFHFSAPWLRGQVRIDLQNTLDIIYLDNIGETVLFSWTEKIRDFLHDFDKSEAKSLPVPFTVEGIGESDLDFQIEITHSDTITDRKSTFQGHCAKVTDITEVEYILRKLKSNKKIAGATHNIMAYRIKCPKKKCILKDYDDDGETHAGSRVLHLLEISEIENVVVIITRWYGGIHLGPDRFKHINNAARNALQIMGVIKTKNTSQKGHNKS
ncbi:Protein IMPACT [Nymphon striatum]|nr:Protein IMPACT [Nymphon striatum]